MSVVLLQLDTSAPVGVAAVINSGAVTTTSRDVTLGISTGDSDPTGYQVKVWGDADTSANAQIQATEGASAWFGYTTSLSVRLSTGEGAKTLNLKVRDAVNNESGVASDSIVLDTTTPVVTTGSPDVATISKQAGKDTSTFTFQSDSPFEEFKVKVVPQISSANTAGVQVPTTAGSSGVAGTAGGYAAATNRTVTIKGADLEAASAGDGQKVVKVFVRELSGTWSA